MDTSGDGAVDQAERKAFMEKTQKMRQDRRFTKLDANNDGVISRSEYDDAAEARKARRRARMDVDGDGEITKEDRKARREAMRERHKAMKERRKESRKDHKRVKPDANGDGVVDLAEHMAVTKARFDRMDRNGNGVLDEDEQRKPRFARHHPMRP